MIRTGLSGYSACAPAAYPSNERTATVAHAARLTENFMSPPGSWWCRNAAVAEKKAEKKAEKNQRFRCSAKIIGRSSLFDLIQYNDRIKTFFDIIGIKIKNGPVFAAIAGIHCGG